MRQSANQRWRRVRRQHRVGIERDHVFHVEQRCGVTGLPLECRCRAAAHDAVEIGQLAALPFPAHPHALCCVPFAWTVQEVKRSGPVFCMPLIQFRNALQCGGNDRVVAGFRLGRCVGKVAQDRKVKMCFPVCEKLYLQRFQRLTDIIDASEERRNHNRRAVLRRHTMFVQIQSRQRLRRQQRGDQLIQHRHGDVQRRKECQADHKQRPLRCVSLDEQHHDERRQHHENRQPTDKHRVRVPMHHSLDLLGDRRRIAGHLLEFRNAVVDQPETDVRANVGGLLAVCGRWTLCQIDRPLRHRRFAMPGPLGDALDHVSIAITRCECHLRIEA